MIAPPATPEAAPLNLRQILARGHMQLVLCSVIIAALALTLAGGMLIRSYAKSNLGLVAQTVSYAVEPSVYFGDAESVDRTLVSIAGITDVARLDIIDAAGRRIGHWRRDRAGTEGRIVALANTLFWPRPYEEPIVHDGKTIGRILIYGHSGMLLRYAAVGLAIGLACLGVTLLAMRLLARRLQDQVARPIERVADISARVRTLRDFDLRVEPAGIVEIDRLGQDFNALLDEIKGWQQSLETENARLAHRAEHDALTGLGNRIRFERRLDQALAEAVRRGGQCSLLFIDVDQFKRINDMHGHEAGDRVLAEVAARLRASLRETDDVFRLGGDEFAVITEHDMDHPSPDYAIEKIGRAMMPPVELHIGPAIAISVSIGAATFPRGAGSARELLRAADAAMYARKDAMYANRKRRGL